MFFKDLDFSVSRDGKEYYAKGIANQYKIIANKDGTFSAGIISTGRVNWALFDLDKAIEHCNNDNKSILESWVKNKL